MQIKPYTHTVISAEEAASLVLCAPTATLSSASCSLPDGNVIEITVGADNTVSLLSLGIPCNCRIDAFAQGTKEAAFTATVEIVPRHYFELDELKNYGDGTDDFTGKTDAELRAKRQKATEVFERAANRSFIPRMGTTKAYVGNFFVRLNHCDVERVVSPACRLIDDCQVEVIEQPRPDECEIVYIYGTSSMPEAVKEAVLALAAYYLRESAAPDRATGEATEAGFLRYTIAGRDGATGIPEIDAIAEQFGRKRYGVA